MSTTAQWIFETAVRLMDEAEEGTWAADTADTARYKSRTIAILELLQAECFPYSDTCTVTAAGTRPVCPPIPDLDTPLGLDDGLCRGVLPYGLAAHLLADENAALAAFFQQRYEERREAARRALPREFSAIEDVYGGVELGTAARW